LKRVNGARRKLVTGSLAVVRVNSAVALVAKTVSAPDIRGPSPRVRAATAAAAAAARTVYVVVIAA
jgi:hypothetical protein